MAILSIDMGGSHISVAVVRNRELLAEATTVTPARSMAAELDELATMGHDCLRRSGLDKAELRGVAVGFCGIVDGETGEVLSTLGKYIDAPGVDLHGWAKREFAAPLRAENDACLALLGEHFAGAAQDTQDVVMITLGTGIGGAAMIGGQLLRSRMGQAGCLGGHMPVAYKGRLCSCGNVGCAEAEASTVALPGLLRAHPHFGDSALFNQPRIDFQALFDAVDATDRVAKEILQHCVEVWSALTVSLVHAYGPELVLFGGGIMQRGDSLLKPIRDHLEAHVWRTSRGLPRIALAQLGVKAALLGGEALFSGKQKGAPQQTGVAAHV